MKTTPFALLSCLGLALALIASPTAHAAVRAWDGDTSATWATAGNWDVAPVNDLTSDIAYFNLATYGGNPVFAPNAGTTSIAGISVGAGNGSMTLTTTALSIGASGITVAGGAGATAIGAVKVGNNQNWQNDSSSLLTLSSTVTNVGNVTPFTVTINGSGSGGTTITGAISNGGATGTTALNVNTTNGSTTLNGTNTFTGGLTLTQGTLKLGNNAALGGAGNIFTISGGTVDVTAARTTTNNNAQNWNGDFTFAGSNTWSTGTGAITLNAGRKVTATASTMTVGGIIGDGGSGYGLTKSGAGTLALSGANTFSGATAIDAGILNATTLAAVNTASSIGKGSVGGSAADLVFGGGTLQHNAANVATTDRLFTIGNANGLTATLDSSSATSTNTMSFTGAGALAFGGSGARTLTLAGSNTGSNTLASIIGDGTGGATSLFKSGAGLWVLSGSNNYTGPTTITAGTLSAGATDNLGGAASNIVFDGGTLRITGTTLTSVSGIGHTVVVNSGKTVSLDINTLANTFTYDQVLNQGTGGLTKLGAGILVLNQTNTYSGATTITGTGAGTFPQAGVLKFSASTNLGDGSATNGITMSGNGVLNLTSGTVDLGANRAITLAGTGFIQVDTGAALTLSANITSMATASLNFMTATSGTSSVLVSGNITDGGSSVTSINIGQGSGGSGLGTIEFTGANSYSGQTFVDFLQAGVGTLTTSGSNSSAGTTLVQGGTLNLNSVTNGGIASGQLELRTGFLKASTVAVLSNAILNTNNFNVVGSQSITFNGDFTAGAASGRGLINSMSAGVLTLDGAKFNLGTASGSGNTYQQDGTGNTVINSIIQDYSGGVGTAAGNLTKIGTGTLTLSGANTYTGVTTLGAGTISVNTIGNGGVASSLGQSSNAATNLVFNGGTLVYTGANATSDRAFTINAAKTATINTTNNLTLVGATGTATSGALSKTGAGTLTFTGTNTYTGVTSVAVNGGTLQFAQQTSLYNNNTASWTAANIRVATGGTLAFNVGGTGEFTTGDVTTLLTNLAASTNATTNGMAAGSALGFDTTNASGGTFTISNVLANTTGAAGGARGLTKLGAGALVLSNTNTYTGTTTVSAGTLVINGNDSAATGNVSVAVTATLGGNGTLGGATTINGILAPGNSIGQITIANDVTWNDNDAWKFELGTSAASQTLANSAADGANDRLYITGGATSDFLKGTGSSFTFDFQGTGSTGWYKLVDWTGTAASSFANGDFVATGLSGALTGSFVLSDSDQALYLNVVPEPSTWALLAFSLTTVLVLRRRRI